MVVNDRGERTSARSCTWSASRTRPRRRVAAVLPLGLTGNGRGSGHIANFVKSDCTQAWIDGGDHVEVVDLTVPTAPRSLGKFESAAANSDAFNGPHDTELDSTGTVWNVGGGGAAGYQLTANPLAPQLLGTTGAAGTQSLALQRLHPPQLAAPREDAAGHGGGLHRHRRGPARRLPRPGQVRDLGPLAARQRRDHSAGHVGDRAERHVHRRLRRLEGACDGELLVALVRRQGRRRGRRLVRAGRPLPRLPHAHRRQAGRLLHPGQRLDLGGVLVADRPERARSSTPPMPTAASTC